MNPWFLVALAAAAGCGIAVAAWPRPIVPGTPRAWPSLVGLAGLIAALLAVGVVSGTLLRHVVQVTPPAVALLLAGRGAPAGRAAALPILTFWLGLMALIWLFLLDAVRLISGHFTITEIALTIAIGMACAIGLIGGASPTAGVSAPRRLIVAVLFAAAQIAALVSSMLLPHLR